MRKFVTVLVLLLSCGLTFAQQRSVTGKVTSEDGSPLAGATVSAKGGNASTTTDVSGRFTLSVGPKVKTLIFSYVGLATTEVDIEGGEVNVSLKNQSAEISEVIVTGVAGATSKKKMTVSVTKVGAEQLQTVPASSAANALAGKVAGLKTSSVNGNPGQGADLLLRGDNNLGTSSAPLILVDGVILSGSLADINIDDVESMEVVKGAAAAAAYGSRAGNGVISVITKRGKGLGLNKPVITVRNELGMQDLSHYLKTSESHYYRLATDWQTAQGKYTKYAGVTYPANYIGAGFDPGISGSRGIDADGYMDNPFGVYRNPQAEFFRTGVNLVNFISVANRTEKNNVYLSFENNKQEGVVKLTDGYERQNFRFNIDQNITPWLRFSASNLFINRSSSTAGAASGLFYNIARMEKDVNLGAPNPDGQPYYLRINNFNAEVTNPLYPLYKQKNSSKSRRWVANYNVNIRFTPWADLDVIQTMETENFRSSSINPQDTWTRSGGTAATMGMSYTQGSMSQSTSESRVNNTQINLNLAHKFGNFSTRGKLSYLYENRNYESNFISASQFRISGIENFENFSSINDASSYVESEKAQNYFAILGMDWKDKILFDGMFRYDGSSLFGSEARWNPYYRASAGYRISEDFKIKGIDELKVRVAYGTAGIRPGFDWQYEVYNLSNGNAVASQKGNNLLKPSTTEEKEIGLNVDFLKKFSLEVTYAESVTRDQFLNVPLIPFLNDGFNSQWQNAGTVKSNTLELTFGANWIKKKDFSWKSTVVFSRVKQRITELPIAPYLASGQDFNGDQNIFYVKGGEVYGAIYGYRMVRTLEEMATQLPAGKTISDYVINSEGYVIPKGTEGTTSELPIKRLNADGSLWYGKIGNGNPDFVAGITNTLTYKGFQLYILLDWKQGGDIYNGKEQRLVFNYISQKQDMTNVPAGQKKAAAYWGTGMYDANNANAYWVEDGTYLKVREIALGYSVPTKALSGIFNGFVKGINAKVIGRNLLTFSKYSGYDPEVGTIRFPVDGISANPIYRNIAFSLQFNF
ncbi:SusC/RagA family TonB-linked outer membrane protein [Lacibacter sediminis]|uniref:SusC/RagA family TonB-linked outer membrane protein n=1 Tax=Lacibacter sediminis TaxID=2760713 RepID=A0A7G5XJX6_9BACT|nr:SusC/RagA family TonB-linked outer membrane protein [Lacibacter sediminis]QNA45779.1 SusC/RagA family TonB-linked outer membrane protein [Lacibacter sediminis]